MQDQSESKLHAWNLSILRIDLRISHELLPIRREKWVASFHDLSTYRGASKEVIDDLHSVELEKKVRLPDPSKAMEAVWKMLRRTKQQMDLTVQRTAVPAKSSGEILSEKKRARVEADRRKAQATTYAMRTTIR